MATMTPEELEARKEAARQRGKEIGEELNRKMLSLAGLAPPKPPKPKMTPEQEAQAKYEKAVAAYEAKRQRQAENLQWANEHPAQHYVSCAVVLLVTFGLFWLMCLGIVHVLNSTYTPSPPGPFYGSKSHVRMHLNDPDSALFSNTFHIKKGDCSTILCGAVNAKNGFGGYVGYQPFVVMSEYEVIIGDPYRYRTECTR